MVFVYLDTFGTQNTSFYNREVINHDSDLIKIFIAVHHGRSS